MIRACIAVAAVAVGMALPCAAIAAAEPEHPVDPPPSPPIGIIPPRAAFASPLAQAGMPATGPAGLPDLAAISDALLVPQAPAPALPGAEPGTPPDLRALNNAYLLLQNTEPSAPGQGQVFGVAPGEENADVRGRDFLKRLYATYQDGGLQGALLGRRPFEPGQPLPEDPPCGDENCAAGQSESVNPPG